MKDTAAMIFHEAVSAVNPYHAVMKQAEELRKVYQNGHFRKLFVIGFGKASVSMAQAIEDVLGELITDGVISTKLQHSAGHNLSRIKVFEASHPVPCHKGVAVSEEIVSLCKKADKDTLVVTLISGGGSALFIAPADGITLAEKQQVTSQLLTAGADICELNSIRKHLSKVKGGRLAELIRPAANISLILSDVLGDHLDVIASGPTSPDPTSFHDAIEVLNRFKLAGQVPQPVIDLLRRGANGELPETPKPDDTIFREIRNIIIGSNRLALDAARDAAENAGINGRIVTAELSGEARNVARDFARKALQIKKEGKEKLPLCLISGGETTVTVTGSGSGGRNMELALAFAIEIEGITGITLLSAGTDGNDGPTDATGAIVDGSTIPDARKRNLDPEAYLHDNDSYSFFKQNGGLLVTGPTGTNVMDIQLIIVT